MLYTHTAQSALEVVPPYPPSPCFSDVPTHLGMSQPQSTHFLWIASAFDTVVHSRRCLAPLDVPSLDACTCPTSSATSPSLVRAAAVGAVGSRAVWSPLTLSVSAMQVTERCLRPSLACMPPGVLGSIGTSRADAAASSAAASASRAALSSVAAFPHDPTAGLLELHREGWAGAPPMHNHGPATATGITSTYHTTAGPPRTAAMRPWPFLRRGTDQARTHLCHSTSTPLRVNTRMWY